ncbi:Fe2+ transport system protein A [Geoglobus ahangari]|uniref:Fe2+ transport system protein A n=1 Tax=Geoglobus ahangari TaxID=113653 RepID=A0A0F7IHW7_9EURY|nr:FeoA family protein [Geoglobus ahangari]AKG92604.1 Fe2+ transport system protein A [Geoglobus ahangari]
MKTLDLAETGKEYEIVEVSGGRGAVRNLRELGFLPGRRVRVLKNWGSVLVSVNGATFVVGGGLARKVVVRDVGDAA